MSQHYEFSEWSVEDFETAVRDYRKENAKLRDERDHLKDFYAESQVENAQLREALKDHVGANKRKRDALEWYGDEKIYPRERRGSFESPIERDRGERARKALGIK